MPNFKNWTMLVQISKPNRAYGTKLEFGGWGQGKPLAYTVACKLTGFYQSLTFYNILCYTVFNESKLIQIILLITNRSIKNESK
jgi:hypothetical protein